jgi:hypothetical protein
VGCFPQRGGLKPHGAVAASFHGAVSRLEEDGEVAFEKRPVVPDQPAQAALDGFDFLVVVKDEGDVLGRLRTAVEQ